MKKTRITIDYEGFLDSSRNEVSAIIQELEKLAHLASDEDFVIKVTVVSSERS